MESTSQGNIRWQYGPLVVMWQPTPTCHLTQVRALQRTRSKPRRSFRAWCCQEKPLWNHGWTTQRSARSFYQVSVWWLQLIHPWEQTDHIYMLNLTSWKQGVTSAVLVTSMTSLRQKSSGTWKLWQHWEREVGRPSRFGKEVERHCVHWSNKTHLQSPTTTDPINQTRNITQKV